MERYGDALIFYINGYIKDLHDAEDLMIEAFSLLFAKERPIRFLKLEELDYEPPAG